MGDLGQLEAMGFPLELASRALSQARGNVSEAAAMLAEEANRPPRPLNNHILRAPDHPPPPVPRDRGISQPRADNEYHIIHNNYRPAPPHVTHHIATLQPHGGGGGDAIDPRTWPAPRGPEWLRDALQRGMYVDVRDTLGKWLEAEVVDIVQGSPRVHYLGWDSKWDEVVQNPKRIASCHKYSAKDPEKHCYDKGMQVFVWLQKPFSTTPRWIGAVVAKVDHQQLQVEYHLDGSKYQYWYHVQTDEIRLANDSVRSNTPVAVHPDLTNGTYFQGQFLEVRDNVTMRWRAAEVLGLKPNTNQIQIRYDGLSSSWNELLHVEKDAARIKPLGADIPDTPEIAAAKREDEEFREGLKNKGLVVVDVERDGNCLFRSVAHQMYNDMSRHAEVRKLCYDYMLQDTEFFSCFVAEDFATYVERQKQLNQWGDHPEVVALREIFNVNVEVYDKTNFPNPLYVASTEGISCILRLSFHGRNHYNSLVGKDFTLPLLPLAETSKINLKQLRLDQLKSLTTKSAGDAKEDPTIALQNSIRAKFGLGKMFLVGNDPKAAEVESQLRDAIDKRNRKGYLIVSQCPDLVVECLKILRDAKSAYWEKKTPDKNSQRSITTVEQEFSVSVKSVAELTKAFCEGAAAPGNPMLVMTVDFQRNLLAKIDGLWGRTVMT